MSFIFYIVLALAGGAAILGLLATLPPIPQAVIDALTTGMGWASSPTNIWPVATTFEIVGYVVLIEGVILSVRLVLKVWGWLSGDKGGADDA